MTLKDFYRSKQWESFRRVIIAERTNPDDGFVYCALCGKPILRKYDLIIDHITELTDANVSDAMVALNPDNVRCLHFKCHNERHERFGFGTAGWKPRRKKVYIVYGAPCAGKTTWVRDNATPNDLIVDIDSIYQMISINDRYAKPDAIKSVVFDLRDKLLEIIKYRSGRWQDAYIITGGALRGDRERLADQVAADDFIFIDQPADVCLLRAAERNDPSWATFINDWFAKYQP